MGEDLLITERWHPSLHRVWHRPNHDHGSRLPLILLHEGLGSVSAWADFPERLARHAQRDVLVYDRIGYGQSPPMPGPWPADFMHREAKGLARLLAEERVETGIFVGHSDGATISLLYPSQTGPEAPRPAGIVSLSAHVFVEEVGVAAIEELQSTYRQTIAAPLSRHHDNADAVFDGWSEVWLSERFRPWTIDDELRAVTCPVLAAQGASDGYGTDEQVERVAAAVGGPSELVLLDGVDHWPHKEAPEQVLTLTKAFANRHRPVKARRLAPRFYRDLETYSSGRGFDRVGRFEAEDPAVEPQFDFVRANDVGLYDGSRAARPRRARRHGAAPWPPPRPRSPRPG